MSCNGQAAIIQKTPAAKWDISIDWSATERDLGSDTIASSSWAYTGADNSLVISDEAIGADNTSTTAWFAAGTVPNYYAVTNTIITAAGRTLTETFMIQLVPFIFISSPGCL